MVKKIIFIGLFFVLLIFFFKESFFYSGEERIGDQSLINEIRERILTPPPLKRETVNIGADLTVDGIIKNTNIQRRENNLQPLLESSDLNNIAQYKVNDMFQRQYFDHISPINEGVGDIAKKFGYNFIAIGENLALGGFLGDEDVVRAWMESPGHRENILNDRYQEIGVAAKKGIFEGKNIWLAVQIFSLHRSACPSVNEALLLRIDANKLKMEQIDKEINLLKGRRDIEEHNRLVIEYNALASETQYLVNEYNAQVKALNDCIAK